MTTHETFTTERLTIRPTLEEDAQLIYELMNTPKFLEYVGDRKITSADIARDYIKTKILPQLQRLGFSSYTLITRSTSEKIGTCGLYDREGLAGIDIGFALLPLFEGQGYGYESSLEVMQAAFEVFALEELKAITSTSNIASQRLLEKLGFENTGLTKLSDGSEELFLYQKKNNLASTPNV